MNSKKELAAIAGSVIGVFILVAVALIISAPPKPKPVVAAAPVVEAEKKIDLGAPQGAPVHAILTDAPMVPPPTDRKAPGKVVVDLEVKEVTMKIADGASYTFWTFGGKVPGKFIRIRHGDTVEFHLRNASDSKLPHNIDLHAVTGPGGGAAATFTAPGHESRFTFKALNEGLYVYHCATAPVGLHVANGMYGLIFVEPQEGLPKVDHEYYVMQGDFYTTGNYREPGEQQFDQQRAIDENPSYVLFNGADGSLVGPNALKAKVGETVRLFVGNGGPNLTSSFHVIGEIFDKLYTEGGSKFQTNVQTTMIPAGGSAIAEFKVDVPGTYALVDHSLFRAFNKGAVGQLVVEGQTKPDIFNGQGEEAVEAPAPVKQEAAAPIAEKKEAVAQADDAKPLTLTEQIEHGKAVFNSNCAACHRGNGEGMPGMFPPLAGSDFLMADKKRSISIVLNGLSGPVEVNGKKFNSMMPAIGPSLSDDQVANVLTFVRNSFGNKGEAVKRAEVKAMRGGGTGAGR